MSNYLGEILPILALLIWLQHAPVFVSCHPLDTVAVVNQSTFFNCSTVSPKIVWHHSAVGSDETRDSDIVYRDGNLFAKYKTDFHIDEYEINGTYFCNLIIKTVKESFAGKYECRDKDGVRVIPSAQLIVIDSKPACRPNSEQVRAIGLNDCDLEPEQVELTCGVSFIGNIPPNLKWTADVNQKQDVLNVTHKIANGQVTSSVTLNSRSYVHDTKFKCHAAQLIGKEHVCTFDVKVLYAMNITMKIDKVVGDEVNCSVNTNSHLCRYEWIKLDDKDSSTVSSNSVLKIENSGLHQCQATCNLVDKKCLIFGTTVNASASAIGINSKEGLSGAEKAVITVFVILTVILVIVLVFCIRRKRREIFVKSSGNYMESLFENVATNLRYTLAANVQSNSGKPIAGIAVCKEELLIVFEGSSTVEVFHTITFAFEHSLVINNLNRPLDIASCPAKDCFFIYALGKDSSGQIHVIDINGSLLLSWETGESVGCLSVTFDSSVILSVRSRCLLKVYSADGLHLRDVKLPSNIQPFHALEVTEEGFIITGCYEEKDQKIYGICLVNSNGELVRNISEPNACPGSLSLSFQSYLSLISDGEWLIANSRNSRILLVTRTFQVVNILSAKDGLIRPVRIYFDYSNDPQLFVADNGDRNPRVMIYKFQDNIQQFCCFATSVSRKTSGAGTSFQLFPGEGKSLREP